MEIHSNTSLINTIVSFIFIFSICSSSPCTFQYHLIQNKTTTYNDAHEYCISEFGTHLATVYDDCGINEIQSQCNASDCWIGIEAIYNGPNSSPSDQSHLIYDYKLIQIPPNYILNTIPWISPQPNTQQGTALCTIYNSSSNPPQFQLIPCHSNLPNTFLCNIDDNNINITTNTTDIQNIGNCEENGMINHFEWDDLMAHGATNDTIPYSYYDMNVIEGTLDLEIDVELEYLGYSIGERHAHIGTTYVLGFVEFEGDGAGSGIDIPGTCENRKAEDFEGKTWKQYWNYSDTPYINGHIASQDYLAYPPDTPFWHSFMDTASTNSSCTRYGNKSVSNSL